MGKSAQGPKDRGRHHLRRQLRRLMHACRMSIGRCGSRVSRGGGRRGMTADHCFTSLSPSAGRCPPPRGPRRAAAGCASASASGRRHLPAQASDRRRRRRSESGSASESESGTCCAGEEGGEAGRGRSWSAGATGRGRKLAVRKSGQTACKRCSGKINETFVPTAMQQSNSALQSVQEGRCTASQGREGRAAGLRLYGTMRRAPVATRRLPLVASRPRHVAMSRIRPPIYVPPRAAPRPGSAWRAGRGRWAELTALCC